VYELLGICLVLTALLAVNSLASLLFTAVWRLCERKLGDLSAHSRAEILFGMRILPPAVALILVSMLVLPAYIGYEPQATGEIVSTKLASLALVSAAGFIFACWRAYRSWIATRSLLRQWLRCSQRIDLPGISIPTFRIEHSFPIIAVVGSLNPRLFVAAQVLDALNKEELGAAIAHERGHLIARDNLKRSLLRGCRDLLPLIPFGRSFDRAWAQAAEAAADEHAARQNPERALNLASALVKIAKMIPVRERARIPLGAYLIGAEESQGVKARIRRLLDIASDGIDKRENQSLVQTFLGVSLIALAVFTIAAASNPTVLIGVHDVIERTVRLLC